MFACNRRTISESTSNRMPYRMPYTKNAIQRMPYVWHSFKLCMAFVWHSFVYGILCVWHSVGHSGLKFFKKYNKQQMKHRMAFLYGILIMNMLAGDP